LAAGQGPGEKGKRLTYINAGITKRMKPVSTKSARWVRGVDPRKVGKRREEKNITGKKMGIRIKSTAKGTTGNQKGTRRH